MQRRATVSEPSRAPRDEGTARGDGQGAQQAAVSAEEGEGRCTQRLTRARTPFERRCSVRRGEHPSLGEHLNIKYKRHYSRKKASARTCAILLALLFLEAEITGTTYREPPCAWLPTRPRVGTRPTGASGD